MVFGYIPHIRVLGPLRQEQLESKGPLENPITQDPCLLTLPEIFALAHLPESSCKLMRSCTRSRAASQVWACRPFREVLR